MSWRMKPRLGRRSDPRWWFSVAAIVGVVAGAAYLFDPDEGRGRRNRLSRRLGRRITGGPVPAAPDRFALLDRVESELFKNPSIPHGKLTFDVAGTTVVLRGELDSEAQIARVVREVRGIAGVGTVKSFLHLPGTPAPNKIAALAASAVAASRERWPDEPPPDVDSER